MSKGKLLTFAIPTCNGAEFLAGTIDSILSGLPKTHADAVEVLISDNCSSDATPQIAEKYCKAFPGAVRYRRNPENLGYDRNVDLAIREALGEYVWLVGDDDYLVSGAVPEILAKLQDVSSLRPAALIVPADHYNMVRKEMVPAVRPEHDIVCKDGDSFFRATMWATSSMASIIVRRDAWEKVDLGDSFGSQWVHLAGLIKIMRHQSGIYLSSPTVVVRIRNPRWEGNFGNQLWAGVIHLEILSRLNATGYAPEIFNDFLRLRMSTNLMAILTLKPSGLLQKLRIAWGMARYLGKFPSFWLIHFPALMFIPNLPRVKRFFTGLFRSRQAIGRSGGGVA